MFILIGQKAISNLQRQLSSNLGFLWHLNDLSELKQQQQQQQTECISDCTNQEPWNDDLNRKMLSLETNQSTKFPPYHSLPFCIISKQPIVWFTHRVHLLIFMRAILELSWAEEERVAQTLARMRDSFRLLGLAYIRQWKSGHLRLPEEIYLLLAFWTFLWMSLSVLILLCRQVKVVEGKMGARARSRSGRTLWPVCIISSHLSCLSLAFGFRCDLWIHGLITVAFVDSTFCALSSFFNCW